ncbi:hypothetical protein [Microbulbifer elongatus]|uniref:hypothetical protein n=1 Tax=Microbulbifer elongatus TaxID=86173 RepID=UPI001CFCD492|nr:hypothetical protein [Microbulbifer elongatus]
MNFIKKKIRRGKEKWKREKAATAETVTMEFEQEPTQGEPAKKAGISRFFHKTPPFLTNVISIPGHQVFLETRGSAPIKESTGDNSPYPAD